jgi:hypothetical protein
MPDGKDKYAPKRYPEYERAAQAASNEIRYAANGARQNLPSDGGQTMKDLEKSLLSVATGCADAQDEDAFKKCETNVRALDAALGKASSSGVTFPRIAPASITPKATAATAKLARTRGPGPAEKAYIDKRGDAAAKIDDVVAACQAASGEGDDIAREFEKADEPIRLVAVTHKMSLDSQCGQLNAIDALRKTVEGCKKTPKKPECVDACGKAKARVEEGLPAAALSPMEKTVADVCK